MPLNLFNKPKTEKFFAVEINQQAVKAAIWNQKADNSIEVITASDAIAIADTNPDTILQSLDISISSIESSGKLIDKVIFGLEPNWVDDNGIKKDKRDTLKYICQNLKLKPVGFLVTFDGILKFLQAHQDNPISAIFCHIYEDNLVFNLVRLGKAVTTQEIKRTEDIASDFDNAFKIFSRHGSLPEKVYLFDSNIDFATIKQQLDSNFSINSSYFSKDPVFESLPQDFSIKATATIGGLELLRNNQKRIENAATPEVSEGITPTPTQEPVLETEPEPADINLDVPSEDPNLPVGFVIGQDIDAPKKTNPLAKIFAKKPKKVKTPKPKKQKKVEEVMPSFILDEPKKKKKAWLIFAITTFIIVSSTIATFWYFTTQTKAEIVLSINADIIEETVDIIASQEANEVDFDKLIVPATPESIEVEGEETIPTTGTIKIGEKAEGTVTIYNKTKTPKTFPKDKILISSSNLRFLLSESVEVASASAEATDEGENISFGKAEVKVVASGIGEDYNLLDNSQFTLKDLSEDQFTAKAMGEISGGTSENRQAVSQDDIDNVKQILTDKLIKEAETKLASQLGSEIFILQDAAKAKLVNIIFDSESATEAETLTITAGLELETLIAKQSDFRQITSQALKQKISDNYSNNLVNLTTDVTKIEPEDDQLIVQVKASAQVKPKIDLAKIKEDILSQNLTYLDNRLKTQPNFNSYDVIFSPSIAGKLSRLPGKPENITIKLED